MEATPVSDLQELEGAENSIAEHRELFPHKNRL